MWSRRLSSWVAVGNRRYILPLSKNQCSKTCAGGARPATGKCMNKADASSKGVLTKHCFLSIATPMMGLQMALEDNKILNGPYGIGLDV